MKSNNLYTVFLSDYDNENQRTQVCKASSVTHAIEKAEAETNRDSECGAVMTAQFVVHGSHTNAMSSRADLPRTDEYVVNWCVDTDASSPVDAALAARELFLKPDTTACVFDVTNSVGEVTRVDLLEHQTK